MRVIKYDILKAIGIICIILAHINPPGVVFQIRNFDVILLIIISANLFMLNKKRESYINYIYKRIKRLIIPTYIFLVIFYGIALITRYKFTLNDVIHSFLLDEGLGCVWIIRIYLISALLMPIVKRFIDSKYYFGIVTSLYIVYEALCYMGVFNNKIIYYCFAFIIPVLLTISIGVKLEKLDNKKLIIFSLINFVIFLVSFFIIYKNTGNMYDTNYRKYPMRLYYLSYAYFASTLLFLLFKNDKICNMLYNRFVEFISKHSLWIYFWQVPLVLVVNKVFTDNLWILRFVVVLVFSSIITFTQSKIIELLEKKYGKKKILIYFKG